MKTTYNEKGDEVTELLWETVSGDTSAGTGAGLTEAGPSGAGLTEAAAAGDTAAASASDGKSGRAVKERQEPTTEAGNIGNGGPKKPSAKKVSGAAGAKSGAKVNEPPFLVAL